MQLRRRYSSVPLWD